jgi:Flp pilus assembly protein TadD
MPGDDAQARRDYRRALALNPRNTGLRALAKDLDAASQP